MKLYLKRNGKEINVVFDTVADKLERWDLKIKDSKVRIYDLNQTQISINRELTFHLYHKNGYLVPLIHSMNPNTYEIIIKDIEKISEENYKLIVNLIN